MSWEISGFLFDGLTQMYFERGAYHSSFPSFLRILGAKKNSSKEKIPPATARSCSAIQSFQLLRPLQPTQGKTRQVLSASWSLNHPLNQQSAMIPYRGWHVKMFSRGNHVSPRGRSPSTCVWTLARHRNKPVAQSGSHTWPRKSVPMIHHQAQSLEAGKM